MNYVIIISALLIGVSCFITNIEGVINCANLTDITKINEKYNYIEGDILLGTNMATQLGEATDPFQPQNAVVTDTRLIWPGGVVPYILDASLNGQAINAILAAIQAYKDVSCITLVPRSDEVNYVRFFADAGCYSYIGMISGRQDISIGRGCEYEGIVIHEIYHALGRWHEQSREDRDDNIMIVFANIQAGRENNFNRLSGSFVTTQNIPYDYGSIMHYGEFAFNSIPGERTIITNDVIYQDIIGQRSGLSELDIQHVNLLYGCDGQESIWGAWSEYSTCEQNCRDFLRMRSRNCIGINCPGAATEIVPCGSEACGVTAMWGDWISWSTCTMTCGGGTRLRTRSCQNGQNCVGSSAESEACNVQTCPMGEWNQWGQWSTCSQTCGSGLRNRVRTCTILDACSGSPTNSGQCNTNECQTDSQLLGSLRELGCYEYAPMMNLFYYVNATDINLDRTNRQDAINQIITCAEVAVSRQRNIEYFGMIDGYCIQEGSDEPVGNLRNFLGATSTSCVNQVGNLNQGFAMTVFLIYDSTSFIMSRRKKQTSNFNDINSTTNIDINDLSNCGLSVNLGGESETDGAMSINHPQPMTIIIAAIMSILIFKLFMYI